MRAKRRESSNSLLKVKGTGSVELVRSKYQPIRKERGRERTLENTRERRVNKRVQGEVGRWVEGRNW